MPSYVIGSLAASWLSLSVSHATVRNPFVRIRHTGMSSNVCSHAGHLRGSLPPSGSGILPYWFSATGACTGCLNRGALVRHYRPILVRTDRCRLEQFPRRFECQLLSPQGTDSVRPAIQGPCLHLHSHCIARGPWNRSAVVRFRRGRQLTKQSEAKQVSSPQSDVRCEIFLCG